MRELTKEQLGEIAILKEKCVLESIDGRKHRCNGCLYKRKCTIYDEIKKKYKL